MQKSIIGLNNITTKPINQNKMNIATLNLTLLTKIEKDIELVVQMFPEKPSAGLIKFELPDLDDEQINELRKTKTISVNNIIYHLKPFQDEI